MKTLTVALGLAGLAWTGEGQEFGILPLNHIWKYEVGRCLDDSSWEHPGFDDSTWLSGSGGFTGGETSVDILAVCNTRSLLPPDDFGGRAMYFRTKFNVASTEGLSLIFSNAVDDAAVFYLNGVRLFDLRVPLERALCNTFGGAAIGGGDALLWEVTTPNPDLVAALLLPGVNTLAVSVHQRDSTSGDMVFACVITGSVPPPPPASTNLAVRWSTLDGGGGASTNSTFTVRGTLGQPDAGQLSDNRFAIKGGFWGVITAIQMPGAPLLTITRTEMNTVMVSWPSPSTGFNLQQEQRPEHRQLGRPNGELERRRHDQVHHRKSARGQPLLPSL